MPSRVERPTRRSPEPHHYEKATEDCRNKNWVHKEALHVALGSILTPKRPPIPPSSRSTSGSATPVPSTYHTPGTGTPVHPPPFGSEYLHPHHPYLYRDTHHHASNTPSKLAQSSSDSSQENSPNHSTQSSPALPIQKTTVTHCEPDYASRRLPPTRDSYVAPPSPGLGPIDDSDPRLRPIRPTLTPLQPLELDEVNPAKIAHSAPAGPATTVVVGRDGSRKVIVPIGSPKAKFFETLQGKSAWDALIHGSFS